MYTINAEQHAWKCITTNGTFEIVASSVFEAVYKAGLKGDLLGTPVVMGDYHEDVD